MTPSDQVNLNNSHPHIRTGFSARYLNPFQRKIFVDRSLAEETELLNKDKNPPNDPKPSENGVNAQKLEDLVEKSHDPLLGIRTAIPFDPFPNEVIIDINKINIIFRYFFSSKYIHSVFIKDVSDVIVETSLFFSTLKIVDVGFTENSIDIKYLRTKDAIKARKIIQGLVVAQKNGIDLAKCEDMDIASKLEELGQTGQRS